MASLREKGESSRSSKRKQKMKKNSVRSVDPSHDDDGLVERQNLPQRIFATNRYPPDGRINSYSKPEYLLDIVNSLEGTPEFEKILESPFGSLFQLPVRKCSLSGKLVHNILCRGLVTEKEHELWFVYAGKPFRFSLREFAIVTGLPCGPFPSVEAITEMQTPPEGQNRYWDTLICSKNSITVQEIVKLLKRDKMKPVDKRMPGWRRLRLALLVIVEGILICGSQPVRVSLEVVEMVRNLQSFMAYPWGRESFELTLRMIKVGSKVETLELLVDKFIQSHTLCHGFPLAIQLLIFRSIPLLEEYLPEDDDETFAESEKIQLTKLKSYHNNKILQTEFDPNVEVKMILQNEEPFDESSILWPSDTDDPAVDYLQQKIEQGHQFTTDDWLGGYTGCAMMTPTAARRVVGRLKPCKGKVQKRLNDGEDDVDDDIIFEIEVINYAHRMELEKLFESKISVLKAELKREIFDEMKVSSQRMAGITFEPDVNRRGNVNPFEEIVDHNNVNKEEVSTGVDQVDKTVESNPVSVDTFSGDQHVELSKNDMDSDEVSPTETVNRVLVDMTELGMLNDKEDDKSERESIEEEESGDDTGDEDNGVENKPKEGHEEDNLKETKVVDQTEDSEDDEGQNPEVDGDVENDVADDEGQNPEDDGTLTERVGMVVEEDEETEGSGEDSEDAELADDKSTDVDGQKKTHVLVGKRGTKRSHDPIQSESSNDETSRPKRQRVVPSRFRSPGSGKNISGEAIDQPDPTVYTPFGGVEEQKQKKFLAILAAARNKEFVIDGHAVKKLFFKGIHTPKNWVDTTQMEAMLSLIWRKQGDTFLKERIGVLDTWFTKSLANEYKAFKKHKAGTPFAWPSLIKNTVRGILPTRATKMMWYRDLDLVYAPMNFGKGHWVALAIELKLAKIHILDPLISANSAKKLKTAMTPIVSMLPSVISDILCNEGIDFKFPKSFDFERVVNVSQNKRTGDCGPLAVKFIELDAQGYDLDDLDDEMVDKLRMKYAVDIYEEFVHSLRG